MTDEIRYRNPAKAVGYANLLHVCMMDPRISDGAYRTYHAYLYYAHQNGQCFPFRSTIAELRGVSERAITRHNRELEDAGYITRQRRMDDSSITYIEDIEQNSYLKELGKGVLDNRREKNGTSQVTELARGTGQKVSEEELTNEELTNEELLVDVFEDDFEEEVEYVEDGDEFGDKDPKRKQREPKTSLQIRMCNATGRRYLAPDEVTKISRIEKGMMSLTSGVIAKYPTEWVDMCIEWAQNKNLKKGTVVTLQGLLGFINKEVRKAQFLAQYQQKHGEVRLRSDVPYIQDTSKYEQEESRFD